MQNNDNTLKGNSHPINEDILKGKWKQFRGEVQKKWGKLTDDNLDQVNGDRMKLEGMLQEKYGIKKAEVNKQIDELLEMDNREF